MGCRSRRAVHAARGRRIHPVCAGENPGLAARPVRRAPIAVGTCAGAARTGTSTVPPPRRTRTGRGGSSRGDRHGASPCAPESDRAAEREPAVYAVSPAALPPRAALSSAFHRLARAPRWRGSWTAWRRSVVGGATEDRVMRGNTLPACWRCRFWSRERRSRRGCRPRRIPILFVTQVPVGGFASLTSTFGNHSGSMEQAPRGGDLVIRYADGTLRFLTQEAGFGNDGHAGCERDRRARAVRALERHKALFSMVVGAPTQQYQVKQFRWQIYEVSGLGAGRRRRASARSPDSRRASTTCRRSTRPTAASCSPPIGRRAAPRTSTRSATSTSRPPTVTGIYSLDEDDAATLTLLEHAPSGAFSLSLDSFGRVIFTKWDHLQRDQQGDAPGAVADVQGVHLGERGGRRRHHDDPRGCRGVSRSRAASSDPGLLAGAVDGTPSTTSSRGS